MYKYDLPKEPRPESDADLYEGDQLPDTSSIEEFIEDKPDWSEDISEVKNRRRHEKQNRKSN